MRHLAYNTSPHPAGRRTDVPGLSGEVFPVELIQRLMKKGSVLCARCQVSMIDGEGRMLEVCPKCGKAKACIALYWKRRAEKKGKVYRYFLERQTQQPFSSWSAAGQLVIMNGEMKAEEHPTHPVPFNPLKWMPRGSSGSNVELLLNKWIKHIEEDCAPGTLHSYNSYVENYFKPQLGHLSIDEIDTQILKGFAKKIPAHLKLKYQRCILNGFHSFMTWCLTCEDANYIGPIPAFPDISGDDSEPAVALTIEEQQDELERIPEQHRDIYEFGCETLLRSGELSVLKISDINRFKRDATIRRTESDRQVCEIPKGKKYKIVHLSDRAMEIAEKHLKGRENDLDAYLFINPVSAARYTVQVLWRYANKHTLHKLPPHQLIRHSSATQLSETAAELGLPDKYVQEALRHADMRTTNRYTHTRESVMRKLVNQRGQVVSIRRDKK